MPSCHYQNSRNRQEEGRVLQNLSRIGGSQNELRSGVILTRD